MRTSRAKNCGYVPGPCKGFCKTLHVQIDSDNIGLLNGNIGVYAVSKETNTK